MDIFYKPPLQRPDECKALEENYMNCLMQKALKDRVTTNKCVMDSILWFHLECPKDSAKFDDPTEFKRKFRNFLSVQKAMAELVKRDDEEKAIEQEFGHQRYPEDVRANKDVRAFHDEFKQHSILLTPDGEDTFEEEEQLDIDEEVPVSDRRYGKALPGFEIADISQSDSVRF